MGFSRFILLLLLPLSLAAAAAVSKETGEPKSAVEPAAESEYRPAKSVAVAYAWAVGGTVLGAPLLGLGLIVGPSLGQYYAGSPEQGTRGMLMRLAGAGLVYAGLVHGIGTMGDAGSESDAYVESVLLYGGIGLFFWGAAYSLWDTHRAVDRFNARGKAAGIRAFLSPALFPRGDGRVIPGFAARVGF